MTDHVIPMPSGAPRTLPEAFQNIVAQDPGAVSIRTVGGAQQITWREYADRVRVYAAGLAGLGVTRGDTVAIMLTNRPEFHLVDTSALHLGATPFSIYNTSSPEQIAYLLSNARASVVITEPQFLAAIEASGVPVTHLVCVQDAPEGTLSLDGLASRADPRFDFEAVWRSVQPDDVCTLIYTSGTTGSPKGVELTHANLIAQCAGFTDVVPAKAGDRVASYLPSAHIADRITAHYMQLTHGVQTTDVADARMLASALPDIRPHIFMSVPRIWDKLRFAVEAKVSQAESPVQRRIGAASLGLAKRRAAAHSAGKRLRPHEEALWQLADRLLFTKIRAAIGFDGLRIGLSGAAAISPETLQFFAGIGLEICEVWGLSESCAGTTVNPPGAVRIGTVGKPIPGIELKLAADGEVLVRGRMVMRGYRDDPARTADTFDADGWLMTGDVGTIDDDGYLSIIDRKKELIISAAGKNMSPTNIENTLKSHLPMASAVVVIGDGRHFNTALIALDPDTAPAVGTAGTEASALATDPAVLAAIDAGVAAGNAKLSRVEQVRCYHVTTNFWEPGGDELTPTLKLKRRPIYEKYADQIDEMYSGSPA